MLVHDQYNNESRLNGIYGDMDRANLHGLQEYRECVLCHFPEGSEDFEDYMEAVEHNSLGLLDAYYGKGGQATHVWVERRMVC